MKHSEAFPNDLSEMLQSAEIFEVWFLEEESDEERFYFESEYTEFEANQKKSNISEENRNQLIAALLKDVKKGGELARCWIPHHGIKAIYNNQLIEIAVCFMCSQCRAQIIDETVFTTFPLETESESKAIFDRILSKI